MKKMLFIIIFIILFIVGCGSEKKSQIPENKKTINVKIVKAEKTSVPEYIKLNGFVSSDKVAFISPKINGYIEKFYVVPGEKIYRGEILFSIKNKEISEKVKSLQAKLKSLYSMKKETSLLYDISKKSLKQAEANFKLAGKNFKRYKNLVKTESITPLEFDKMKTDFINAKMELEKAKKMEEINKLKIVQLNHNIQSLRNSLNEVKTVSDYRFVKAPFDGVILEKYIDAGNLVSPGVKVLKMASMKKVAYFTVPSKFKSYVKVGDKLFIKNQSVKIIEIYPDVSRNSLQFKIKTTLPEELKILPNGSFMTSLLKTGKREALLIDKKFVRKYNDIFYTYLCKNSGEVVKAFLTLKEYSFDKYEILTGLDINDDIIKSPLDINETMKCSVGK